MQPLTNELSFVFSNVYYETPKMHEVIALILIGIIDEK